MNRDRSERTSLWPIALFAAVSVLLVALLWFRLGSLTHGNAADIERTTVQAAGSWRDIVNNPLNAPYSAAVWLVARLGHQSLTTLRLVSTLFAALAAVLFYIVARQWHSQRVALLASWLFASSAWFLHTARLGSPEILWIVSMLSIVVLLTPNRSGRQNRLALPSTLLPLAAVLYVPGMVWLVLTGAILQRKNIREAWQASSSRLLRAASLVAGVGLVLPLAYGLAREPSTIIAWLGVSGHPSIRNIADNLLSVPMSLLIHSTFDSVHWLGHLPLLSAFEIVMLLLGLYFYGSHLRAARTRLLFVLAVVGAGIVAVAGTTAISLLVPVVYLLATAGIAYLLHFWLKVFPNNPLARGVGIAALTLLILLTSLYQTRSYFVAWRYSPETHSVFSRPL